ncbi:MAG: hypothetical protein SVV80_07295 [Planctomycetota bacterium]|nr:hypothetical protein [Planctomycetota bacterium]
MPIDKVKIGNISVSRLIIGGNPFSGFSHHGADRDAEMRHYYTVSRIKQTLRQAEELGINAHLSRADHHIMRYLMEYWDEGGEIFWMAQTCPELGTTERGINNAIAGGAKACHIHGGTMDFLIANNQLDELPSLIAKIRQAGLAAGIAGHTTDVFAWARENLDVDYYMCSYYNPIARHKQADHVSGTHEQYLDEDRRAMVELIRDLNKPVIHYKVLAAGRNDPAEAFDFVARHLRPQDAVCVGVYTKERPNSLPENLQLLTKAMETRTQ